MLPGNLRLPRQTQVQRLFSNATLTIDAQMSQKSSYELKKFIDGEQIIDVFDTYQHYMKAIRDQTHYWSLANIALVNLLRLGKTMLKSTAERAR